MTQKGWKNLIVREKTKKRLDKFKSKNKLASISDAVEHLLNSIEENHG